MTFHIERLRDADEAAYERFVARSLKTLLYHGAKYRRLLRRVLDAEDCYLVARDASGEIAGALPGFIARDRDGKGVLNSLPFYGSNGGLLEFDGRDEVRVALVRAFERYAVENGCVSSTIVTSPFESDGAFYDRVVTADLRDERLGQITPLPRGGSEDDLLALFHHKTRTAIRKAQQQPLTIDRDGTEEALDFLVAAHQEGIRAKQGLPKTQQFFATAMNIFEPGREAEIWTARHEGRPVAALLLFYYNRTVEYFTPVVVPEYRAWQPLSWIIVRAMAGASARGFEFWNWGGTWASQDSLRRFKSRLGAIDHPYAYYTRVLDSAVLSSTPADLLTRFPNFYVVPFSALTTRCA